MCITMHGSENVKSVFSYVVCLMVMCAVKQVAYSTTTEAVLWLCARYDHGYSPITMCNKAEFPQQYGSSVNPWAY